MPSPAPDSFALLKVLLVPLLAVHLAFAGQLLGGSLVAVIRDFYRNVPASGRRGGVPDDELQQRSTLGGALALFLLVSLAGWLFCLQGAYPAFPFPSWLWGAIMPPLAAGLAFISLYSSRRLRPVGGAHYALLAGLAGICLSLVAYFALACLIVLLLEPAKWPFLVFRPELLLSWSGVAQFALFLLIALTLAGAQALSVIGRHGPPLDRSARTVAVIAGGMLILWPVLVLFDLYNLPRVAISAAVFVPAALTIILAGCCFYCLILLDPRKRAAATASKLLLGALLVVWLAGGHFARENALNGEAIAGVADIKGREPVAAEPTPAPKAVDGREVFERVCTPCHSFDRKLIGPPLNEVLSAYRGNMEALQAFIRAPVKKNPDYPLMPYLDLNENEIEAVTSFLMNKGARPGAADGGGK